MYFLFYSIEPYNYETSILAPIKKKEKKINEPQTTSC
jgi:hypothetical protein